MEFTKAHGTGNDFVVIADPAGRLALSAPLIRALCDRRRGVGADGVLRILSGTDGADVTMDYRNADGSAVAMCGNGLRVVAAYAASHGLVPEDAEQVVVATPAGLRTVRLHREGGRVVAATVDMGPVRFRPEDVPVAVVGDDALAVPVEVDGQVLTVGCASLGNPHAVVEVADVADAPVATLGPALETHPLFPDRVNVSFAAPIDRHRVALRTWERGVGETAACGSAACATVAVLHRRGQLDPQVTVEVPGGVLEVALRDGHAWLTGAVREVFTGHLDPAALEVDAWNA